MLQDKLAPNFSGLSSNGEEVKLLDFIGKNIVLYFYPKDMTPGCTQQACDFKNYSEQFNDLDTIILGVSTDSLTRHSKFIEKYGLPFLLISDEDATISKLYDVWKKKKNFGKEYMGIERSTFYINKEGIIEKEWRKLRVKDHVEEVLTYIQNK